MPGRLPPKRNTGLCLSFRAMDVYLDIEIQETFLLSWAWHLIGFLATSGFPDAAHALVGGCWLLYYGWESVSHSGEWS